MIKLLAQTELVVLYRETKNEEVYMEIFNRSMHVVESLTKMFSEYNAYMDVEAEIIFILNEMIMKSFNPNSRLSFNAHFKMVVIRKMSDFIDEIAKEKEIKESLNIISHQCESVTPLDIVLFNELIDGMYSKFLNEANNKQKTLEDYQDSLSERINVNLILKKAI